MIDITALRHVLAGRMVDGSASRFTPFPESFSDDDLHLLSAIAVVCLQDIASGLTPLSAEARATPLFQTAIAHLLLTRAAILPQRTPRQLLQLSRTSWHRHIVRFCQNCDDVRLLERHVTQFRTAVQNAARLSAHDAAANHYGPAFRHEPAFEPPTERLAPTGPLPRHPPRPIHWRSPCSRYVLAELTHPLHLISEGRALNHCIHRHEHPFSNIDPPRSISTYARQLYYWRLVEFGEARLFSFMRGEQPLITLHMSIIERPASLVTLGGPRNHKPNGTEPFFPQLVEAIQALWQLFPNAMLCTDCGALHNALLSLARPPTEVIVLHHPFTLPRPSASP